MSWSCLGIRQNCACSSVFGGNVPHITYEVLQMVSTENFIMHMPLTSIMTAYKSIESFGKDLSEFVGLKEYPSYITPQDPAIETPSGYNLSDKVAIWSKNGKREVDPTKYMKMMESMKPDMYLALCDGDTNSDSSRKRIIKSASRTTSLFKECFKIHHGSEALRNTALLAPLEGGYDIQARRVFTEEIASYDVSGFVLDGLHTNGPEAEKIRYSHIKTVITACVERLPKEKLRVAHGAWNPATILQLVAAGFDMFDTALPYLSTERGAALNFSFDPRVLTSQVESTSAGSQPVPSAYEICLENIIYLEDFNPVLSHCSCLTCKHHTRAYIHHLLKCKELLGRVLLMIHNLHHYLEFFKSIRNAIRDDCLVSPGAFVEGENYQLL